MMLYTILTHSPQPHTTLYHIATRLKETLLSHLEARIGGFQPVLQFGDIGGIGILREGVVDQSHHQLAKSRRPCAFVAHRRHDLLMIDGLLGVHTDSSLTLRQTAVVS